MGSAEGETQRVSQTLGVSDGEYSLALLDGDGAELFVRRFSLAAGHVDAFDRPGLAAPLSFTELLLHTMIRYRPNDGAEWQTLAADWTDTGLAVSLADLPGGAAARVQVLASDGFDTGEAVAPAFVVQGKPPQVQILMPQEGTVIEQGERLILRGAGSDLEGELGEAAFTWASDRDGPLGAGRRLETTILSPGPHVITLAAEDGGGQVGAASVTVEVTVRPNTQPVADAGPDVTTAGRCSVLLDGGRSFDADGEPLACLWSVVAALPGRRAWLSDAEGQTTRFFAEPN